MADEPKTWKREKVDLMMVCWIVGAVGATAASVLYPDADLLVAQDLLSLTFIPILGVWAAMYGVDWYGKQSPHARSVRMASRNRTYEPSINPGNYRTEPIPTNVRPSEAKPIETVVSPPKVAPMDHEITVTFSGEPER